MKRVVAALSFLTLIGRLRGRSAEPDLIGSSAPYFPLAGLLLGIVLALMNRALEPYLASEILAVVLVATLIALTAAIPLAQSLQAFDALGGGAGGGANKPAGAYGFLALLLIVLFKVRAVEVIGLTRSLSLVLTPVLSRWALVLFLCGADSASELRAGQLADAVKRWHLLVTSAAVLALTVYFAGRSALWIALALSLLAVLSRAYLKRRGGFGFVHLGALIEVSEALSFVLFASL
jgi:adenosylcobinamide-GDP ribazoletransferase